MPSLVVEIYLKVESGFAYFKFYEVFNSIFFQFLEF
jgi:hypothetical protein